MAARRNGWPNCCGAAILVGLTEAIPDFTEAAPQYGAGNQYLRMELAISTTTQQVDAKMRAAGFRLMATTAGAHTTDEKHRLQLWLRGDKSLKTMKRRKTPEGK